jgi:hypothetical protein
VTEPPVPVLDLPNAGRDLLLAERFLMVTSTSVLLAFPLCRLAAQRKPLFLL